MALKETFFQRYYLLSISNLFAAFGGGLILGKATSVIRTPYLHGGSILAFFIGSILGLAFINFLPKKLSKNLLKAFSVSCSFISLLLYCIYSNFVQNYSLNGIPAIIFFSLLVIRFSLWFYSRVKRASESSGLQQSIAWVEFGYYSGMVLGLIFWQILNINVSLQLALLIDAIFQFCAGLLDIYSFKIDKKFYVLKISSYEQINITLFSKSWCARLSKSVVLLTVGVQVLIFNAAHFLSGVYTTYILATFYLGVAASAFFCKKYNIFISWKEDNAYLAALYINMKNEKHLKISILYALTLIFIAIIAVCLIVFTKTSTLNSLYLRLACFFVFLSSFVYETLSLSFLDRIGYEEKAMNNSGLVMKTYGLMGIYSAVAFWIINIFHNNLIISTMIIISSISYTGLSIFNRSNFKQNSFSEKQKTETCILT